MKDKTFSRWITLSEMIKKSGGTTAASLAHRADITKASASRWLAQAVKDGVLEKSGDLFNPV